MVGFGKSPDPVGGDWQRPDAATRMRDVIETIATQVAEAITTYRMATVLAIRVNELDVEFTDEPGNTITIGNLPALRPKAIGQRVEILIRNGTDFSLYRVFGEVNLIGASAETANAINEAPANLRVDVAGAGLTATWDPLDRATAYDVQWSTDVSFATGLNNASSTSSQFDIASIPAGAGIYVRVRGKNSVGVGPWSGAISPLTPTGVTSITATSSNRSLSVIWSIVTNAEKYELQRSNFANMSNPVVEIVTANTRTLADMIVDRTWYLRVRAINAAGVGAWSPIAEVTITADGPPLPDQPTQVQNLRLSSVPKSITSTWDPETLSESYLLQRGNDAGFVSADTAIPVEGSQYTFENLVEGQQFWFRVRGVNSVGNGPWSATQTIVVKLAADYTDGAPPSNSPITTVSEGIKQLIAEWPAQANKDPVTYEVHMSTTTGFIPSAATKLGETAANFWITNKRVDGTPLLTGTRYYIRVIAKDRDGSAPAGAQGSGIPQAIDLGSAGDVSYSDIKGDAAVPGKPGTPVIVSGIGYLVANWTRPVNVDPIEMYDLHVSTNPAFIPDANTLSLSTAGLFAFIRKQGPGAGGAPLAYGVTYYIKVVAKDIDGFGPVSDAGSGFTVQTNTADIVAGSIVASKLYAGSIEADRIQAVNIAAQAITAQKIYSGSIMSDRIQAVNIATGIITAGSALIQDAAIGTAMIGDGQITNAKIGTLQASKITSDTLFATVTVSGVIRSSSATQRVEINSSGLFMYDSGGNAVVSINAASGSAYFKGNIEAINGTFHGNIYSYATIHGGTISGTYITGTTITSGNFRTSDNSNRIEINAGGRDTINFYTNGNTLGSAIGGQSTGYGLGISSPGGTLGLWGNSVTIRPHALNFSSAGDITLYTSDIYLGTNPYIQNSYDRLALANHSHGSQSVNHADQYMANSYLSDGALFIRGYYDGNHKLQYALVGRDGPDLRGFSHVGIVVTTYTSGAAVCRWEGNGNMLLGGGVVPNQSLTSIKREVRAIDAPALGANNKKKLADSGNATVKTKDKVKQLKAVRYLRNDVEPDHPSYNDELVGFLAEEMEQVFPEVCGYEFDTGKLFGISYGHLTVPLVQAMQDMMVEIEALQQQVAALKK